MFLSQSNFRKQAYQALIHSAKIGMYFENTFRLAHPFMSRPIDSRLDFLSPVSRVPGLGPKRAEALTASGQATIGDLLYYFPRRFIDRSTITPIGRVSEFLDSTCSVIGAITRTRVERGRRPRLRIQVTDDTGAIEVLWFHGVTYLRDSLRTGMRVLLTGKVSKYTSVQMVHPLIEPIGENRSQPEITFLPRYAISSAMRNVHVQQRTLSKSIIWVLDNLKHYPNILPAAIEREKGFPPLSECIRQMHLPADPGKQDLFQARLRYEELYRLALTLRWSKRKFILPGRPLLAGSLPDRLKSQLPFSLTNEQQEAIAVLHQDAASDHRMHRLLQGDVGSGKTVVALFACLPALNSGYQVVWLTPTEILAQQTYEIADRWIRPLGVTVGMLKGGMESGEKRRIQQVLDSGEMQFVVGTHALLHPLIRFKKLGMIVVDEQHKFGAQQRLRIQEKDPAGDFLLLSATPIPQTLAKTLYGDLDVVSLKSSPVVRSPVETHIVPEQKRAAMEEFIINEIQNRGSQVFYVAPRIEADEEEEEGIADVQSLFRELTKGPFSSVKTGLMHGNMDADEKQNAMARFASGEIQLLVATSVIEVGIDISAAHIIVIENAERFGLSQLHQLRGRVGRKGDKAYCFLMTSAVEGSSSQLRLKQFCKEHDGFKLAELDLSLRGPGEVAGFRQWGWEDLQLADILRDAGLFREIQATIDTILPR